MRRHIHICQSVPGALRNWKKSDWVRVARENDMGKGYSDSFAAEYCKHEFERMNRDGIRVIPIGEKCEGFSYQSGCPGHPIEEARSIDQEGDK